MGFIYQLITCPTMSGDYDQTDQVSHGCFLRHCSNICHGPELVVFTLYIGGSHINYKLDAYR